MPTRVRTALLGAGACLVLLALVWVADSYALFFRHADQSAFVQFYDLQGRGTIPWLVQHLTSAFAPRHYVFLAPVPIVVALLCRRPRIALAAGVMILGANETTQLLKAHLAAPRLSWLFGGFLPLPPSAWPSGHSTAVMALVLALVLAVPPRLRPATATLGALLAIAVGYSVVAAGLHYPSDVLGGFLVAGVWALTVVAALLASERRWPVSRTSPRQVSIRAVLGAPGAVVLGAAVIGVVLLIAHPHSVISFAGVHQAFFIEAAAIAAISLTVSTAVLLSLRR